MWMALMPLISYWRLKKFCIFSSEIFPLLSFSDSDSSLPLLDDISLLTFHLCLPLPCFIPDYCKSSVFLTPSFSLVKKKFPLEEIHSDESLWPLNPLIRGTCNAVIMCDWRMKKGDISWEVARKIKEKEGERKEMVLMERDKWKELASRYGWLAPELSPSISYNSCSSRVTPANLDIQPQPI